MSNVSCWLGPPHWCRKMTDLARALRLLARGQQLRQGQAEEAGAADAEDGAAVGVTVMAVLRRALALASCSFRRASSASRRSARAFSASARASRLRCCLQRPFGETSERPDRRVEEPRASSLDVTLALAPSHRPRIRVEASSSLTAGRPRPAGSGDTAVLSSRQPSRRPRLRVVDEVIPAPAACRGRSANFGAWSSSRVVGEASSMTTSGVRSFSSQTTQYWRIGLRGWCSRRRRSPARGSRGSGPARR